MATKKVLNPSFDITDSLHLGDVPIVSGAPCKSPKTEHLSSSSRLVALSSSAQNRLADLVGKASQGNSPLVLLFLRNIPR